jgi:hypothetical protein
VLYSRELGGQAPTNERFFLGLASIFDDAKTPVAVVAAAKATAPLLKPRNERLLIGIEFLQKVCLIVVLYQKLCVCCKCARRFDGYAH